MKTYKDEQINFLIAQVNGLRKISEQKTKLISLLESEINVLKALIEKKINGDKDHQ